MARSDGSIIIDTRVDADGFGKGVKSMKSQIGGLTSAVGKLGAAIGLVFGVKALVDFGKSAIELGSDLQEVQNVVDVTFSTMNEAVNEFAKNAAETAGLSETMAKRYTGTFGAMAKAFGFAEGQAFDMATSLTQLSGDVASFYNLTQDEAYTKLKSVFTGETESLKDLGVVMTQTALDSYAMAKGFGKTTSQMSEQEKVALRYSFVLDQLSSAQGDFVRTSDSWANQTRILSLNFDSLKANIGQALINIFTPFLKILNQIVDKMAQLSQRFVAFSEMLVGKSTSGGGGSPGEAVEEIAQGFDEVTDATKEAEKAQKSYLGGLDEIRTFSINDTAIENSSFVGVDTVVNTDKEDLNNLKKSYSIIDNILDKIVSLIKNKDWNGLGEYLSDGIVGALNFLSEKLDDFDWEGLGEDIGDFLAGIDWVKIIKSALKLKINIWKEIASIWFGAFNAAPVETAIITAIAALKFSGLGATFAGLGSSAATAFLGALTAGFIGFNLGQWFYEFFTDEDITLSAREQFQAIKDSFTDGSWKDALLLWGKDISDGLKLMLDDVAIYQNNLGEKLARWLTDKTNDFSTYQQDLGAKLAEWFKSQESQFTKWGENLGTEFRNFIVSIISDAQSLFNKFWEESVFIKDNDGRSYIDFDTSQLNKMRVPALATGAVIPPNAPFMAMLGDQKHGTNIEAPLDTIKQAVAEVVGSGNAGGQYAFTAQINRRTIFEEMIDEAKLRQSTTGKNPFDLT